MLFEDNASLRSPVNLDKAGIVAVLLEKKLAVEFQIGAVGIMENEMLNHFQPFTGRTVEARLLSAERTSMRVAISRSPMTISGTPSRSRCWTSASE